MSKVNTLRQDEIDEVCELFVTNKIEVCELEEALNRYGFSPFEKDLLHDALLDQRKQRGLAGKE